jgi:uncharacterized protein (TIGR02246 family)
MLAWSIIVLVASSIVIGHGDAFGAGRDEDAVRSTVNSFAETWNRHDIDALAKLFARDAEFVIITAQRWKGRQEIQRYLSHLHGTVPQDSAGLQPQFYGVQKTMTYRFDNVDVKFIHRDVAIAYVEWTQLGDPRFPDPRRGTLSLTVTREGKSWVISGGHNTQTPGPSK